MNKISIIISITRSDHTTQILQFLSLSDFIFIAFFTFNLFIFDIINLVIHRDSQNHNS